MYNKAIESRFHELIGPGSFELFPTADRYVVGVSVQQSGTNSTTDILCNATSITKNYGKDFPFNETSFHCNGAINISKTGQDSSAIIVSAVPAAQYGTNTASVSGSFDGNVNIASPSAYALGQGVYVIFFILLLGLLLSAINTGLYIFKK
jgi:hypothetical protein